jgi:DNA-binding transcriptional regulator YhcF (GntR family)
MDETQPEKWRNPNTIMAVKTLAQRKTRRPTATKRSKKMTAKENIVATLSNEILHSPNTRCFPIQSEHQLCSRFNVCRVTVRLALDDLRNWGLIFRQQGKGTFAHARSTRKHRYLAAVLRGQHSAEDCFLPEFLRGAYSFMKSLKAGIILVEQSPKEWTANLTSILAGAIIVSENVTSEDLKSLKDRNLPFLFLGKTELTGPCIQVEEDIFTREESLRSRFFRAGKIAAEALNRAALTGEPLTMDWEEAKDVIEMNPLSVNRRRQITFEKCEA